MLTIDQLNQLRAASDTVDRLYEEIDLDDTSQLQVEVDPGELYQLIETWAFMYEALRSLGHFEVVRSPGLPRR